MRGGFRWLIATILITGYAAFASLRYQPPLPNPLLLRISIPAGPAGVAEPLIVEGRAGAANFLFLRRLNAHQAVVGYDCWGHGGPTSASFALDPARPQQFEIWMPALTAGPAQFNGDRRLRIAIDGKPILSAPIDFYFHPPEALWLGVNPIGGSSCGPRFSGEIIYRGQSWHGAIHPKFSRRERVQAWFAQSTLQFAAVIAITILIGSLWPANLRPSVARARERVFSIVAQHRVFVATAVVCTGCFSWILTGGTFRFNFPDEFGDFFDYQAASLLHGRLDVPPEGIGNEAFVVGGKYYGYFGLTPAIQRLPFVLFDAGFGRLTRSMMVADFIGCLVAAYLLLHTATRIMDPERTGPSRTAIVLLTFNTGVASSLFFLGSRAYVHHETILCGAFFGLLACWCALEYLLQPGRRWWMGSFVCGLLAVHARPPIGLFALVFLGCVAAWQVLQWLPSRRPAAIGHATPEGRDNRSGEAGPVGRALAIGALTIVGVLSFNGVSYLKFGTFDGAPVRFNLQFNAARLAHIEGKNFHLSNLGYNMLTYLVDRGFDFHRHFPWITPPNSVPPSQFPHAKIDYAEGVSALPYSMAPLSLLATLGCVVAAYFRPRSRVPITIVWLSVLPMAVALFAAVASAERYTADFCPFLIVAASFGLVAVDELATQLRPVVRGVLVVATLWSAFVMFGLSWNYQWRIVWGVPADVRAKYDRIAARIDHFLGVE